MEVRVFMTARRWLPALTALGLVVSSGSARGEEDDDSRARDRTIFYAALATTGAGLVTWTVAGLKVQSAEDDLEELSPQVAVEQAYPGDRYSDVCATLDPSDGPASAEAASTCQSGKRWQTIGTVSAFMTIGSAAVTAVFAYRAFRSSDSDQPAAAPPRQAWRAQPIATPTAIGLGVDVAF